MHRLARLYILYILTALFFTWNVEVIILLLNPSARIDANLIRQMFFNMFLYYGPLWFIFIGLSFFFMQFFAEKRYSIGFFNPPSFIYFITFTIFIINLVMFLNYDYYRDFFSTAVRARFHRLILLNSFLIIAGTIFIFIRKKARDWMQVFIALVLALSFFVSANHIRQREPVSIPLQKPDIPISSPRKLKIILMDGLSLNYILSLSSGQKLLNFDWIRQNGVVGRIQTFSPNYDLSLLNTLLTGEKPATYQAFSSNCYQMRDVQTEFEIFPRYILFRNMAKLDLATFYKRSELTPLDNIKTHFEANHFEAFSMITPPCYPIFSEKNLQKSSTFIQFFADAAGKKGKKIDILKRAFYLDDFLVHRIPNFKISNFRYFILNLPGLDAVTTHFYHYAHPQDFPNLTAEQVQEYGSILEKYYLYYDSIIGKMITTMAEDEMLIIYSSFEAEPLPLWRRIFLNYIGKKDIFVYKSNTAPGLILLYEKKALRKQVFLNAISIYDIYPTLIYYAGFPLSKSLKGEVLRDIFSERFLLNNPIITVTHQP